MVVRGNNARLRGRRYRSLGLHTGTVVLSSLSLEERHTQVLRDCVGGEFASAAVGTCAIFESRE